MHCWTSGGHWSMRKCREGKGPLVEAEQTLVTTGHQQQQQQQIRLVALQVADQTGKL